METENIDEFEEILVELGMLGQIMDQRYMKGYEKYGPMLNHTQDKFVDSLDKNVKQLKDALHTDEDALVLMRIADIMNTVGGILLVRKHRKLQKT